MSMEAEPFNTRSQVQEIAWALGAGALAALFAFLVCSTLLLAYLELAQYACPECNHAKMSEADFKRLTIVLVAAGTAVSVASAWAAARLLSANMIIVFLVCATLLVPGAIYGMRSLSHHNSCLIGESYPLDGYWTFAGHECGR